MRQFLLRFHLELYTLITIVMCIYGLMNLETLSLARQIILITMFVGMLHEWEEKRWPGGFFEAVGKVWGWELTKIDIRKPSQWVVFAWMLITIVPFFLESVPGLALAPVFLGLFEAFIHTIGGKLTRHKGKYFPGIVTAWCMAAVSVYCLFLAKNASLFTAQDYLVGAAFLIIVFFVLQNFVQMSAGSSMKKMMQAMRNR